MQKGQMVGVSLLKWGGARERAEQRERGGERAGWEKGEREREMEGERKEKENGNKKRKEKEKGGEREIERERERKGGIRADAMRPRPAMRDGRVRRLQAGFAAWSTAGRPRARRAERRMGQRVIGTKK